MEASILIVSKNRRAELSRTLGILKKYIDEEVHEIRVFLDGCTDGSESLQELFPEVHWMSSKKSLGASKARSILYKTAKGKLMFGFDDDSHPLQPDFINISKQIFKAHSSLGILSFKEIKGIFETDEKIPKARLQEEPDFLVNDFLGCGFAVRKKVYDETRGFPAWIDIYGEEVCLALEVLDEGYDIIFTHKIQVNHRVDKDHR
ncbi:MAG: glycosyltransferase, partial [Salegentibacter sp.]